MGGAVLALLVFGGFMWWVAENVNPGAYNAVAAVVLLLLLWGLFSFCSWAVEAFNSWMDDWAFNRRR